MYKSIPAKLKVPITIGIIIIISFFTLNVIIAVNEKLFFEQDKSISRSTPPFCACDEQIRYRSVLMDSLEMNIDQTRRRMNYFAQCINNPNCREYANAREIHQKEQNLLNSLKEGKDRLPYISAEKGLVFELLLLFFLIPLMIYISIIMLDEGNSALGKSNITENKHFLRTHLVFSLLIFVMTMGRFIATSVLLTEGKTWFAHNSFCISPLGYGVSSFKKIGDSIMIGLPITCWWIITSKINIPKIDFEHFDRECGVKKYLSFIEKYVVFGIAIFLVMTFIWLSTAKQSGGLSIHYSLEPAVAGLGILLLMSRGIRNGFKIRKKYNEIFYDKFANYKYQRMKDDEIPIDPTIKFLGEIWWRLIFANFVLWGGLLSLLKFFGFAEWLGL